MLCKLSIVKDHKDEQTCADALVPSFTSSLHFFSFTCVCCMRGRWGTVEKVLFPWAS